jgi:topoisomerase-4 subunit A
MKEFTFSKIQAEAIVNMQLYKLTNTDVTLLKEEYERLKTLITRLKEILENEEVLKSLMKDELREIKKEYATPRITEIKEEKTEIKIDEVDMVSKEDFIVCISKSGYIKKVSIKSYNASNEEDTTLKEGDYLEGLYKVNNLDTILIFTNMGNYLYLPVYQIDEYKYKDLGYHISNIVSISDGEKIIKSMAINKFDDTLITAFTKYGMVKRMTLDLFPVTRYSKPISMFKLKDNDEVIGISRVDYENVVIVTKNGYALRFKTNEIPAVGLKTSGVKAMKLSEDDEIVNAYVYGPNKEHLTIFTDRNTSKRIKLDDIPLISRAKKGVIVIKSPKSKIYKIINAFTSGSKTTFGYITDKTNILKSSEINIMDRNSVGSIIFKSDINSLFIITKLKALDKEEVQESNTSKEEIKEDIKPEKAMKNLTMSDFFDEFKI